MIEEDISRLKDRIQTLEQLVLSMMTIQQVAKLTDADLIHSYIQGRTDDWTFKVQYVFSGKYEVSPGWKQTEVRPEVRAIVEQLATLGMDIRVAPSR